jgi:hydroxymethylglutaryl-CoA synthase
MALRLPAVGIDDMALYAPKLYLDIKALAEKRQISYEKLRDGLGLHKMAIPDLHEDAATMAAEAIFELINRNQLDPRKIGRIWLGTESALDMAKPTATYAVGMVQDRLKAQYGVDCFRHCDMLDMTFACIGATDALLGTIDWVQQQKDRIGIVVASDIAKYELESTGEYTQGAGAIAILIRHNPRILKIRPLIGVASESVHDFFKPRRERFSETPIFDGQYSNQCYQNRMMEALAHFRALAVESGLFKGDQYKAMSERWARMIFHLPYSFHAKRMYVEQFIQERKEKGVFTSDLNKLKLQVPSRDAFEEEKVFLKAQAAFNKAISESSLYQQFVSEKLEKAQRASSEMGNLYTASIFLALMSTLESDFAEGVELKGKRIGFVAYGSGSKAKVFEAVVGAEWKSAVSHFHVFQKLSARRSISYDCYEALHKGCKMESHSPEVGRWKLDRVGVEGVTLGARYYSEFPS